MALGKKTGGRKKGSVARRVRAINEIIANGEKTPLELLLQTMRDEKRDIALRIDCAKAAAPYVHSRKAQDLNVKGQLKVVRINAFDPMRD